MGGVYAGGYFILNAPNPVGIVIVNGIGPNPTDVVFKWEANFLAYLAGSTTWAAVGLYMPDIWPANPWPELPQGTFTLPAGQSSYSLDFSQWNIWYAFNPGTTYPAQLGWPAGLYITAVSDPTYALTLTASGKGTVSSPSSLYLEGQTCVCLATPDAGESVVKWVKDGVDYPPAATFTFTFEAAPANVVCVFTDSTVFDVTGSYTSLGTNGCALSPYANLGAGNVLIQPKAFIFANGSSLNNGATVEVDSGESVMIAVNTESIYTRIVSMLINGAEYAGAGTNYASRDVSITATSDITVEVQVAADRFCYQTRPQVGPNDPPDAPIPPVGPPPGPLDPPEPPGDTPRPPDPEDPVPPQPPQPPDPPRPPDPPQPPEQPEEDTNYIDFILKDFRTDVELSKVKDIYQAKNTQWIKYVCIEGQEPFEWVFGDRSPNSTETSPVHRYYFKGDNLYEVILYAWAEFQPGQLRRGWVKKLVHVIEDIPGVDPDPDPETTDPEPDDRRTRPTRNWPDLVRTGAEVLTLRWQDDRGVWSKERSIPLDRRDPHFTLNRLGNYRVRSWELVMAAGVPQVIAYMEEEVEINDA